MSGEALLLALPSKGRLQEQVHGFFERAGMALVRAGGDRDYRGALAGLDGVEIVYLSASEIAGELGRGGVHLGVTGEDLIHEQVADADRRVVSLQGLGFGRADVVVAVPRAWIDVRTISDLDDVAALYRQRHGRRLRVATKYLNLTRRFFAAHGFSDYRIVESLGATEGAPASGTAEAIVDITTTGTTLAANGLKVLDDGVILRSEANLIASLAIAWSAGTRARAAKLFSRLAATRRAGGVREVTCAPTRPPGDVVAQAAERFGALAPFGAGMPLLLHVRADRLFALVDWLIGEGAETVTVARLDDVFQARDPLTEALEERLAGL